MKKRSGKKDVKKLKKELWTIFSKYIRYRDCLKTTGTLYEGKCYTCGKLYSFSTLQAGHFIPGRHNSILFDERGVHIQCFYCNIQLRGNPRAYDKMMKNEYGQKVIDELDELNTKEKKYLSSELEDLKIFYKNRIKELTGNCDDI